MFTTDPFEMVVRAIILLTSIPIHEAAHAWTADKLGDPTARYQGRLTLNPAAHLDPIGSIALIFTGIGWAKPVPINPMNFDNSKKGMAISAAAGPISNLIIATISLAITKILGVLGFFFGTNYVISTLIVIFYSMCWTNVSLAIFNLIPIPPFDGSRIFNYFLSDKLYFKIMEYERYIFLGILFVLMTGIINVPLNFLSQLVVSLLNKLTFFVDIIINFILNKAL